MAAPARVAASRAARLARRTRRSLTVAQARRAPPHLGAVAKVFGARARWLQLRARAAQHTALCTVFNAPSLLSWAAHALRARHPQLGLGAPPPAAGPIKRSHAYPAPRGGGGRGVLYRLGPPPSSPPTSSPRPAAPRLPFSRILARRGGRRPHAGALTRARARRRPGLFRRDARDRRGEHPGSFGGSPSPTVDPKRPFEAGEVRTELKFECRRPLDPLQGPHGEFRGSVGAPRQYDGTTPQAANRRALAAGLRRSGVYRSKRTVLPAAGECQR